MDGQSAARRLSVAAGHIGATRQPFVHSTDTVGRSNAKGEEMHALAEEIFDRQVVSIFWKFIGG